MNLIIYECPLLKKHNNLIFDFCWNRWNLYTFDFFPFFIHSRNKKFTSQNKNNPKVCLTPDVRFSCRNFTYVMLMYWPRYLFIRLLPWNRDLLTLDSKLYTLQLPCTHGTSCMYHLCTNIMYIRTSWSADFIIFCSFKYFVIILHSSYSVFAYSPHYILT